MDPPPTRGYTLVPQILKFLTLRKKSLHDDRVPNTSLLYETRGNNWEHEMGQWKCNGQLEFKNLHPGPAGGMVFKGAGLSYGQPWQLAFSLSLPPSLSGQIRNKQ